MFGAKSESWVYQLICILISLVYLLFEANGEPAPMIFLKNGVSKGAVCLDGTPAAYHFSPGSGSGQNNWLIYIEGGGWCSTIKECVKRQGNFRGSSKFMKPLSFSGPLGGIEKYNPDFYNWNRIKLRYCDGSSFTGNIDEVDKKTNLHFRGERVFDAMMEEFMKKGMDKAENALMGGCSAGGLAAILHCDKFHDLLPKSAKVKCFSDAGYFIKEKDVSGKETITRLYTDVIKLHNSAQNLPAACTALNPPEMCFFPEIVVQTMKTPLFILNSPYDSWQIRNILAPSVADKKKEWNDCKMDMAKCSSTQMQRLQQYRETFLKALPQDKSDKFGTFILSCHAHCQGGGMDVWIADGAPKINNTTISKALGDWFFDRAPSHMIDCPYPCNPTCHNEAEKELIDTN